MYRDRRPFTKKTLTGSILKSCWTSPRHFDEMERARRNNSSYIIAKLSIPEQKRDKENTILRYSQTSIIFIFEVKIEG